MGVAMSKTDQPGSPVDDVQPYERDEGDLRTGDLDQTNKQQCTQRELGRNAIPKSPRDDSLAGQTVCSIDDEGLDDNESKHVYQRLKPSRSNDLHVANTKFGGNSLTRSVPGPPLTSVFTQNTTRSAFVSAHSESFNPIMPKSKETCTSGEFNQVEEATSGERPAAPMPPVLVDDVGNEAGRLDHESRDDNGTKPEMDESLLNHSHGISLHLNSKREERRAGRCPSLLSVPEDARGIQSPIPGQIDDPDLDIDPFEGMGIPRERVSSMGSSSIYSVKEISDNLYQEYFYEVRKSIRNYGFFEKFPTPAVVGDAQRTYRQMEIPTPVDEDDNILPHPPRITKEEVFASQAQSFAEIDNRIINVPENVLNSGETAEIVNYLCQGLDDDLSKIRAISTWIAIRQLQIPPGTDKPVTSEDWCRKFRAMCRYSRIKTKLVKGIVRNNSYIPGEESAAQRGVWISVLVNNTWWLVDPVLQLDSTEGPVNCGLSNTKLHNEQPSLFQHAESFFWDPEQFIFTHYPDEEYWQLLARPISREEFAELAVLPRGFFALRLKLISPVKSSVVVNRDELNVSVGYPENSMRQFRCKLYLCQEGLLVESFLNANSSKISLRRFVFLETRLDRHRVNANIRFPTKGSYVFELYGCSESLSWQKLCSYRLLNEAACMSNPYPVNNREEWGPGYDTLRLGLIPTTHKSGEIVVGGGVVQVAFRDPKGLQFRHDFLLDTGRVLGNSDTTKISVLRDGEKGIVFVIDINEKLPATYILQLYAKSGANKPFQNFCNYYVRKVEAEKKLRYQFNHVKVQKQPSVTQAPECGKLQLEVDASGVSQIVVDLKLHDLQELNFSDHARHWIQDDQGFVELNFPRKGEYSAKILGRNVATNHFQTLREEHVRVHVPSEKWSPFPKTESNWSSYYKVERPLTHHLPEKEFIHFSVAIREAQDVAVLAPNGWYHLVRQDDGMWEGQIWSGPKSTKCRLLARFEIGSEKFTDLLWFKVMAEEDFESMEDRQEIQRTQALKQLQ